MTKFEQLDGLEVLLDKLVYYKDTDASYEFYNQLEALYERISFYGPITVTVTQY